ncbi:MAG: ATP-binding cassette domain-containing protein [Deltaproteobacteria bacterium]|nr:ATP-binding cassette domain-containing protein [Deltaproteobacteria bacterium]
MSSTRIYRRLLGYVRPYVWPRFAIAIACMLVFSGSNGVMPFLVRSVFDDIFASKNVAMLYLVPLIILTTFTIRGVANYGNQYFTEWTAQKVITDLRDAMNQRVQYLPLSYFNRTPTGTIVSRVTNDVAQLRNSLVEASVALLRDSASLVTLICVAFYMDWVLAIIGFVVFPVSVLPVLRLSQRLRRYSKRGQATLGNLSALLQETIQGNRIVKAFGMERYELERFDAENRRLFGLYMKASRAKALIQPLMELLAAFGIAGVVLYGGYSVIEGGRTQGDFLAFLTALVLVYDPFKGLAKISGAIQQGMGSAERVFELIDEATDVVERFGARPLANFEHEIRFERVSFRYPARSAASIADGAKAAGGTSLPADGTRENELALSEVELVLRRGEAVALVGGSGGGKSTLADLIPRFYDPTAGRITIDGTDLRDVTIASLRAQIGIVTQSTFLFNDTIRANLAYGSSAPSHGAVEEAARAANAHDFISALPQGYDTVVGELGVMLSGGQRQRIAIARALLKNAPILILDEATSALDSESERLVQDAIERLMVGRTTLVIAHRLATVRRVDRIVVLSDGRVAEEGTHDQLIARGQIYRRLHDQQMLVPPAPGEGGADPEMRLA